MYTPTTTVNIDIPYAYLDCQCHQLSPTVVYCHLLSSAVIVICDCAYIQMCPFFVRQFLQLFLVSVLHRSLDLVAKPFTREP